MHFRARYYDPNTGEFSSRDPLEYVDGASLYRGYFVPGGVDPSGMEVAGWHHAYPCHLGGRYDQPLFYLSKANHTAAHSYFRNLGIKYGPRGRELWLTFTDAERIAHIKNSMRSAGIPEEVIERYIDEILEGARPGVKTARIGKGGARAWSKLGLVIGVVLEIAITDKEAAAATVCPREQLGEMLDWECNFENKSCICTEDYAVVSVERTWYNPNLFGFWTANGWYEWSNAERRGIWNRHELKLKFRERRTGPILTSTGVPEKMLPSECLKYSRYSTREIVVDPGYVVTVEHSLNCTPGEK